VKIITRSIKILGLVVILKAVTKLGVWSLIGILSGIIVISIADELERNYTRWTNFLEK
jgi:hypothetical protein